MTVFLVWVNARSSGRFVDSIWIQKTHAEQRVRELRESLMNMGNPATDPKGAWFVWWSAATASDAVLGVSE